MLFTFCRSCFRLSSKVAITSLRFSDRQLLGRFNSSLSSDALTVGSCLRHLTNVLQSASVSEPSESAEYIIAHAIGRKTLFNVDVDKTEISKDAISHVKSMAEKRLQLMPVQYVIGEWDFRSITIDLRPPVFIPRPETEYLVEKALTDPAVHYCKRFVEIGCGSGAVCISLLKELPFSECVAIDQSYEACELTRQNALRNKVDKRLKVINKTWTKHLAESLCAESGGTKYDFIVCNPPYITTADMQSLEPEVLRYEDHRALDGGSDGLDVVRTVLQSAHCLLGSGGAVWLEVGLDHPDMIRRMIDGDRETFSRVSLVDIHNDFTDRPRFCQFKITDWT